MISQSNNILYYLSSSEDNTAFYVGVTCKPKARLSQHRRASTAKNVFKYNKIKDILKSGYSLQMTPIYSNLSLEEAGILEAVSIPFFKSLGFSLTNIATGGILTPQEARDKRRGVPRSAEVREKIRAGHLGVAKGPQSVEHIESRAKHRRGVKQKQSTVEQRIATRRARDNFVMSEETKQKQRESHLGKKHSPEAIAKMVAANVGKKRTKEHCRRISEGIRAGKRYIPVDAAA